VSVNTPLPPFDPVKNDTDRCTVRRPPRDSDEDPTIEQLPRENVHVSVSCRVCGPVFVKVKACVNGPLFT
jgi:hypothetical protein